MTSVHLKEEGFPDRVVVEKGRESVVRGI